MPRAYATYFDRRYLARGLALVRSLRRHDPEARIYVIGFDPFTQSVLAGLDDPAVIPVPPAAIEAFEPRLAHCRERGAWSYYVTHTAILALWVLRTQRDVDAVAYADSDLWFFASPEPLFAEIGAAPIAISPHRFSPPYAHAAIYGTYNGGFIYWRRSPEAFACLDAYREDCIAWCGPTAEPDGRYMNQGYLNAWPERYPGIHVIRHPGANLAYWNNAGHRIRDRPALTADGETLIFHHFSNLHRDAAGVWHCPYRELGTNLKVTLRAIYRPYIAALEAELAGLRRIPGFEMPEPAPEVEAMPFVGRAVRRR